MPYKDPEKRKEMQKIYRKRHYEKNKEKIIEDVSSRKKEIREWFLNLKKQYKCLKCGESNYRCLDFHHMSDNKFKDVNKMVHHGNSKKKILEEIDKCEVLCANCHRKLHY